MHEAYHSAVDYLEEMWDRAMSPKEQRAHDRLEALVHDYEHIVWPVPDEGNREHPINQAEVDE